MKKLLFLLFMGFSVSHAQAQQTYYVSASGNDSLAGTSTATAWKTLARVNLATFVNGDQVLLRRGDSFPGPLKILQDGVTVDAYGSGNKPVVHGYETAPAAWTLYSGNIWETTFPSAKPTDIKGLYKDGVPLPISRYPNKDEHNGYLNFESHSGITSFTDNELSASPAWTNADILVRCERFRLVKTRVSSHSGGTITIPSLSTITTLRDGYGYFFVNNLNAIDQEGEWAYRFAAGKIYLYALSTPNSSNISFLRTDTCVTIDNVDNVAIRNIQISYARNVCLSVKNSDGITIDGVTVSHAGADGVVFSGVTNSTFRNSNIDAVNWSALFTNGTCNNLVIRDNVIRNAGNEAFGKSKTFIGIDCNSPNSQILNNHITGTGYSGIISAGLNNLVKQNIIDSVCLFLEDNGGIYTNNNIGNTTGTVIEENIVTNSIGERLGAPEATSMANGIYLDNLSQGVTVRNNTVAFINGDGLFIGSVQAGNEIYNNTSFQSGVNELHIYHPLSVPGFKVSENLLVTTDTLPGHDIVRFASTEDFSYEELGTFHENFIISPFRDTVIQCTFRENGVPVTRRYTPSEWEARVGPVMGTTPAIIRYPPDTAAADVVRFYYNTTASAQSHTLPTGLFTDAKNQAYCGSFSLPAYSSLVLFKTGAGSCVTPDSCTNITNAVVGAVTDSSAMLYWDAVTGHLNYDVRYRPAGDTAWKYANNQYADSLLLPALTGSTDYEAQVRSSCYGNEGSWTDFPWFSTPDAPVVLNQFVFVNASYENCSPDTAFALVHSTTDNKWTLINSGGNGTVDKNYMHASSLTEDAPQLTLTADSVLNPCGTYDIYLYYVSPSNQPWKTLARMADSSTLKLYDRFTPGAELLPDYSGTTTSNRLFRAKLGTVSGVTGFSVVLDDINYGTLARSVFDGVAYVQVSDDRPLAPDSLQSTAMTASEISLSWQDLASDETGYVVARHGASPIFTVIDTLPANTTTYVDTIAVPGEYTYRLYAIKEGCRSPYSNQLTVNNEGILLYENGSQLALKVPEQAAEMQPVAYPNPSRGIFYIRTVKGEANRSIRVRDMNGRVVLEKDIRLDDGQVRIDITRQPAGIYLLEIAGEKGTRQLKLVKTR